MSKSNPGEKAKNLMNELDDLVHFLADGPEVQRELKLRGKNAGRLEDDEVPVLTLTVDQSGDSELDAQWNKLVDDLLREMMPKLEAELRRRLRKENSTP